MVQKRAGLLVLFLGELFTTTATGFFEGEVEKAVVLALFVPLLISSGGNAGSQATSIIIRALTLGAMPLPVLDATSTPGPPGNGEQEARSC